MDKDIWMVYKESSDDGFQNEIVHLFYDSYEEAKEKFDEFKNEGIEIASQTKSISLEVLNNYEPDDDFYFVYEETPDSYEVWQSGNYCNNHFYVLLQRVVLE
jgi:hypothetical protein